MNFSINSYSPLNRISYKNSIRFQGKNKEKNNIKDNNPISRSGEAANLAKATFVGGLALGTRLLFEAIEDGDFVVDTIWDNAGKIVKKNKQPKSNTARLLYTLGASTSIALALVAGFALFYTAFKSPKIAYDSKINAFSKGKQMDIYTKSKDIETNLYEQINDEGKNATEEKKKELQDAYTKLTLAKTSMPDFVKQH